MKNAFFTLAAITAASSVFAHSGAHMHPHAETGVPVLAGLAAIALAAFLAWRAR